IERRLKNDRGKIDEQLRNGREKIEEQSREDRGTIERRSRNDRGNDELPYNQPYYKNTRIARISAILQRLDCQTDREEHVGRDKSGSTNNANYTAVEETDDFSVSNSDSREHHHTDSLVHPGIPFAGAHGDLLPEETSEACEGTSQEEKLRFGSRGAEPRSFQSRTSLSAASKEDLVGIDRPTRAVSLRSDRDSRTFPSLELDTVVEERSDPEQSTALELSSPD
ncbi:uncharacterized protein LOC143211198, partial [Lasioglossum baleicum]|uniref:uncharacterized protein LOC143211198 n=1 Tax=Lasioglossum baleicum TaxID=434251 RepID=UPI003FCE9676